MNGVRVLRSVSVAAGVAVAVAAVVALERPVSIGGEQVRAISQPGANALGVAWLMVGLAAVVAGLVGRPAWSVVAALLALGCATPLLVVVVPEGHGLFWRSPCALAVGGSLVALGAGAFGLTARAGAGSRAAGILGVLVSSVVGMAVLGLVLAFAVIPYQDDLVAAQGWSAYSGDFIGNGLALQAVWLVSAGVLVAGLLLGLGWGDREPFGTER